MERAEIEEIDRDLKELEELVEEERKREAAEAAAAEAEAEAKRQKAAADADADKAEANDESGGSSSGNWGTAGCGFEGETDDVIDLDAPEE